jgi:hypothetical protein
MRTRRPAKEPVYHCNCPQFSRRFRYGPKQVDREVQCPQRKNLFTLPPPHSVTRAQWLVPMFRLLGCSQWLIRQKISAPAD